MSRRTALVTGGSRGIGAAIVEHLPSDGWSVLNPTRGEFDLTDFASIDSYLDSIDPVFGVVLNAGVNPPSDFAEISEIQWAEILRVNTESCLHILQRLAPAMADTGGGRIVAISSAYAGRSRKGRAAYSASKAALESLIRSVTVEFADRGVIANAVAPGFVDTELTRVNNDAAMIERLLERVPVGRLAQPGEIAQAVAFLLSPDNHYICGQVLAVDGGWACT